MQNNKVNIHNGLRTLVSDFFNREEQLQIEKEENFLQNLINSEDFRFFNSNINGFLLIYNYRNGLYEYVSDSIYAQLGFSPDLFSGIDGAQRLYALIDDTHAHIFITEMMPQIIECLAKNATPYNGKDFRYNCSFKGKNVDGVYRWFLSDTVILQTEENGMPWRTLVSMIDIHQYKNDEILYYNVLKKDERGIYQVILEKSVRNNVGEAILTHREQEILFYIASGYLNKQIAQKLLISIDTVKAHRRNILTKTNCKGTAELTNFAYSRGLV